MLPVVKFSFSPLTSGTFCVISSFTKLDNNVFFVLSKCLFGGGDVWVKVVKHLTAKDSVL